MNAGKIGSLAASSPQSTRPAGRRPWLALLPLLVVAAGCERPANEIWVPGAKATAFSEDARLAERRAEAARTRETLAEQQASAGSASAGSGKGGPASTGAADAAALPPLKEALKALQLATRSADKAGVEEAVRRAQGLDAEATGRLLVRILKANEEDLGLPAARMLGRLKVHSGMRSLFDRLVGEDIFLAQAAAEALGDLGDASALSQLTSQAKRHPSASVRSAALEAIGRIGDRTAIPGVAEAVQDPDPSVRESAARVLGKLGSPQEHHAVLYSLLQDKAPRVRLVAVLALAELRAPEAVESLTDLLADSSEEVRASAENALVAFPDRIAVRRRLMDALEQKDGSALLNYSQALKTVCDCSCLPDLKRVAAATVKPTVKNACEQLSQQIHATCP